MTERTVQFIDDTRNVVATARVTAEGNCFGGTIDLARLPGELRSLFEEFEEIVNGQMFSFVDEIQAKIAALPLRVVFDDGLATPVTDLQVYPSTGDVSFWLTEDSVRSVRSSPAAGG